MEIEMTTMCWIVVGFLFVGLIPSAYALFLTIWDLR